jgi:hypothetical protein
MRAFATEAEMESFVAALSASAAGVCGVADAASSGPQQTPQGGITIRFARTVYDLQTAMRAKLVNDRRLVANTLALPCMVPLLLLIAAVPLSPAALGLLAAWAVFWGVFFVIRGEAGAALWWWRYRKVRSARRSQDASRTLCAVFAVRINSQGLHISIPESGCGLRIPWHKIKGLTTDAGGIALNHNDDLTGEPIFLPVRAFEGRGDMEAAAAFMWSCILTDGRTSGGKNLGRWSNLATSGE